MHIQLFKIRYKQRVTPTAAPHATVMVYPTNQGEASCLCSSSFSASDMNSTHFVSVSVSPDILRFRPLDFTLSLCV